MLIISLIIFAIITLIVAAVLGLLSSIVAWRIVRRRNWSHKRLMGSGVHAWKVTSFSRLTICINNARFPSGDR